MASASVALGDGLMSRGQTTVKAQKWGCGRCTAGGDAKNAMAMAANHHRQKNHPTWSEQTMRTEYGGGAPTKTTTQPRMDL